MATRRTQNAQLGAVGERIVDGLHLACEVAGVACVRRVSSHVRITGGRLGRIEGCVARKSTVDCLGWSRDGRVIAVEIKCTTWKPASAIIFTTNRLPAHQRKELERVDRAGGIALVVIVFGPSIFAVPWAVFERWIAARKGRISTVDASPYLVRRGEPYLARFVDERNDVTPRRPRQVGTGGGL